MNSRVRSGWQHLSYGMSYLLHTVKIDRYRLGFSSVATQQNAAVVWRRTNEFSDGALVFSPRSGSRSRAIVLRTICRRAPIWFDGQGNRITGVAG